MSTKMHTDRIRPDWRGPSLALRPIATQQVHTLLFLLVMAGSVLCGTSSADLTNVNDLVSLSALPGTFCTILNDTQQGIDGSQTCINPSNQGKPLQDFLLPAELRALEGLSCPEEFPDIFLFRAVLVNKDSNPPLADLQIQVTNFPPDHRVLFGGDTEVFSDEPGGVGTILTLDDLLRDPPGLLCPLETLPSFPVIDLPFALCLKDTRPFTFSVDVLGRADPDAAPDCEEEEDQLGGGK